jgi:hypothetical protein
LNVGELKFLRRLHGEILNGYSSIPLNGERIFFKHLNELDYGEIYAIENTYLIEAKENGLPTYKEKLDFLLENEFWDKEKEIKVVELEKQLNNLESTKSKLFLGSQKKMVQEQINETSKELRILKLEREDLLGFTAEKYVDRKLNFEFLRISLYRDSALKERYYDLDSFYNAQEEDLFIFINSQNSVISNLSPQNIKKIAASPFCLNAFLLSKNNPFVFYGKAIRDLSIFQIDLFTYGLNFKSVLEKGEAPPQALYEDMQGVIDWYEIKLKAESNGSNKGSKKKNDQGKTIMGASEEEMKKAFSGGKDVNTVSLADELKKSGKTSFNMQDMLKIHGEM